MAETNNIHCSKRTCSNKITWEEVENSKSAYNLKKGLCSECGEPETEIEI